MLSFTWDRSREHDAVVPDVHRAQFAIRAVSKALASSTLLASISRAQAVLILSPSGAPRMDQRDPRSAEKKPPFTEKSQHPDQPGRETEMREKPDHGEQSYRGHGRLTDKVALIT